MNVNVSLPYGNVRETGHLFSAVRTVTQSACPPWLGILGTASVCTCSAPSADRLPQDLSPQLPQDPGLSTSVPALVPEPPGPCSPPPSRPAPALGPHSQQLCDRPHPPMASSLHTRQDLATNQTRDQPRLRDHPRSPHSIELWYSERGAHCSPEGAYKRPLLLDQEL